MIYSKSHPIFSLRLFIILLTGCLAVGFLTGCGGSLMADVTPPPQEENLILFPPEPLRTVFPVFSPSSEKGAVVYDQWCTRCHGNTGMGNGPEADRLPLAVPPISQIDFLRESNLVEWYTSVSNGHTDRFMPGFSANLSDREIWDVLAYVYAMGVPARVFEEGHLIYLVNCQTCHGESGGGDGPQAALLDVRLPDWTDPASLAGYSDLQIWKRITAGNEVGMPAFINVLDDDQRWAVTSFIRSVGFSNSRAFYETEDTPEPDSINLEMLKTSTPNKIVIYGKIRNGTQNSDLSLGIRASLQVFEGNKPVFQESTIIGADGSYRFTNVDLRNDRIYLVSVLYQGLLFNSQVVRGSDIYPKRSLELPITIYDSTILVDELMAERVHVFMDFTQSSTLRIIELYTISNQGREVIVPKNMNTPVLQFALPKGAINLQVHDGDFGTRFLLTDDGFGDLEEVYPSPTQHQVLYRYDLPYDKTKTITFTMPMAIQSAVLAIPADGVTLESDRLIPSGQRTLEGILMQLYVADDLAKGEEVVISISGKPGGSAILGLTQYSNYMIGLIFLVPSGAVFAAWFVSNSRRKKKRQLRQEDMEYEKAALLDEIIALDDLFRSNQLQSDVYRNRRNEILRHLKETLRRMDSTPK
jgi:mono/diheme cytochrome c family protein